MIVCDSTSLIHLSKIGKIELLKSVFGKVLIPEAVYTETVIRGAGKLNTQNITSQNWIVKKELSEKQKEDVKNLLKSANIHRGEAEAIVLAKSENLPLLIDDSVGVRVAQTFGIETYWTTSTVLKAYSENKLDKKETKQLLEDLVRSGYRIKPEILIRLLNKLSD